MNHVIIKIRSVQPTVMHLHPNQELFVQTIFVKRHVERPNTSLVPFNKKQKNSN